ncbi:MAG: T9SS type A sorting domain-containing protein [Bacteroidetes bacterium]|nr:T9SS type A sorting domain-containing protein [Bacteroidota bacterium]
MNTETISSLTHKERLRKEKSKRRAASTLRHFPAIAAMLSILLPALTLAQVDTVRVPSEFPTEGTLNAAVAAARTAGKLSTTVFLLEPFGSYVLTGTINVLLGETLTIIAPEPGNTQQSAPPQILLSQNFPTEDSLVTFRSQGEIVLQNVWLLYGNTAREQVGARVQIMESPDTINGQRATFENVIFDLAAVTLDGSGAVDVTARHFRGTFRNCYFKNCADQHYRYYGRAVSFPYASQGWHIDSLLFENCTFANCGYVYNQEGGEYGDNVHFNHCTFLNIIMFPLQSGWWHKLSITNSIFVNTWLFGNVPVNSDGSYSGTLYIDSIANFGFSVPFTEQDRRILFANSSYFTEQWVRDWMYNNPGSVQARIDGHPDWVPVPLPMLNQKTLAFFDSTANGTKLFPYINRAHLLDSTDPGFLLPPTNYDALTRFLEMKWWCCSDTPWAYAPEKSFDQEWPMQEDLSYTNPVLLSAGMGGFPLGDLYRWFPDQYAVWRTQRDWEHARILTWMNTGTDPDGPDGVPSPLNTRFPEQFALHQNYPNPFNPHTTIRYAVPFHTRILLEICNTLGQRVHTLVDAEVDAGVHSVRFDGTGLASGVYVYRMTAGQYREARTLILLH